MALQLRRAGWGHPHPAGRRRRVTNGVIAVGAMAVLSGLAILVASLAPMFVPGTETATVALPMSSLDASTGNTLGDSVAANLGNTVTAAVDRPVDGVAFTMRIPALRYAATVYEGTDERTLLRGPGHYASSAWPGRAGNVGIAAHNVYWLSLARLKNGDRVELQTRHALFVYTVTGSSVVDPGDRTVLQPSADHRLTLTTCYPLWAGAFATRRLVFSAVETGGVA